MKREFLTHSKEETQALGRALSAHFVSGDVVLLLGDLGAGKTTFTGGVAKGLDIEEPVLSPTFNILKCYFHGRIPMYHIDAYRLENQNIELGLDEYIEGDGVCLIEWPKFIESLLPEEVLSITLTNEGGDTRRIVLESDAPHFERMIAEVSL